MPSATASTSPYGTRDPAPAALDQLAQLVAAGADRRHARPEAVEQPRPEGEVGLEVVEMRRDHAVGVHQPRRALGVGDAAVVEEHEAVERAQPLRERRTRRAPRVSRGRRSRAPAREHEDKAHARVALGGLDGRRHRGDGVEPVPDAAVPQHDLGVVADPGEARLRPGALDALAAARRGCRTAPGRERPERGVGRVGRGTDQARREQRAEVEVALAVAAADEVVAGVQRLEEVVERDSVLHSSCCSREADACASRMSSGSGSQRS